MSKGLGTVQRLIVDMLDLYPVFILSELSELYGLSQPSLSRAAHRLQAGGMVHVYHARLSDHPRGWWLYAIVSRPVIYSLELYMRECGVPVIWLDRELIIQFRAMVYAGLSLFYVLT